MATDIRVLALVAVHRDNELLCLEEESPDTGESFYRLLGGGVEFGEYGRDTVVREFDEELGVEFTDPTHVGTFEQVFTYDGETGHEVWWVYEGHFVEEWPYDRDSFMFVEPDLGTEHLARWMPVGRLRDDTTFYSLDVLDALDA